MALLAITEFTNQPVAGRTAKGCVPMWQILLIPRMVRAEGKKPGVSMVVHPSCAALQQGLVASILNAPTSQHTHLLDFKQPFYKTGMDLKKKVSGV